MPFKTYQPTPAAPPTATNPADEQDIIQALRRRDETTYRMLVGRYTPLMLRLARQYVPNHAIAEEVVQDTWMAVLRGIDAFEGRCRLATWLMRILVNTARKRGLREHTPVGFDALDSCADDIMSTEPSPEIAVLATEIRAVLVEAIRELPERQRTVLILRDMGGWATHDVCSLLDVSTGNQRVLLHRARTAVRSTLSSRHSEPALDGLFPG